MRSHCVIVSRSSSTLKVHRHPETIDNNLLDPIDCMLHGITSHHRPSPAHFSPVTCVCNVTPLSRSNMDLRSHCCLDKPASPRMKSTTWKRVHAAWHNFWSRWHQSAYWLDSRACTPSTRVRQAINPLAQRLKVQTSQLTPTADEPSLSVQTVALLSVNYHLGVVRTQKIFL